MEMGTVYMYIYCKQKCMGVNVSVWHCFELWMYICTCLMSILLNSIQDIVYIFYAQTIRNI